MAINDEVVALPKVIKLIEISGLLVEFDHTRQTQLLVIRTLIKRYRRARPDWGGAGCTLVLCRTHHARSVYRR